MFTLSKPSLWPANDVKLRAEPWYRQFGAKKVDFLKPLANLTQKNTNKKAKAYQRGCVSTFVFSFLGLFRARHRMSSSLLLFLVFNL